MVVVDKVEWMRHDGERRRVRFLLSCALDRPGALPPGLAVRGVCVAAGLSTQPAPMALLRGALFTRAPVCLPCPGNANLYSIDVDPTGKRVATSGGAVVKIWNLLPVLDPKAEADPNTPKLLATLTDHISSVNVVRFSRRGRFLASGADDKTISIYELRPGRGMAGFGTKDAASVENWKIVQQLRGHGSNVTDLAWSMDDKYVASCSVDNYIIVWEAETGARVKQLAGACGSDGFPGRAQATSTTKRCLAGGTGDAAIYMLLAQTLSWSCSHPSSSLALLDLASRKCARAAGGLERCAYLAPVCPFGSGMPHANTCTFIAAPACQNMQVQGRIMMSNMSSNALRSVLFLLLVPRPSVVAAAAAAGRAGPHVRPRGHGQGRGVGPDGQLPRHPGRRLDHHLAMRHVGASGAWRGVGRARCAVRHVLRHVLRAAAHDRRLVRLP